MAGTVIYLDEENFDNLSLIFLGEIDGTVYQHKIIHDKYTIVFMKKSDRKIWTKEEMNILENRKITEEKLTREEARKIVFNKCKELEGKESGYLVDALEALGLLKLKEEPQETIVIHNVRNANGETQQIYLSDMEKALAAYDLKVAVKE